MQQIFQSSWKSEDAPADPRRNKAEQMCKMRQIIHSRCTSEDSYSHSHWRKTSQVQTMQACNHHSSLTKISHYDTHWRKTEQVQPVWLFFNYFKPHEDSQKDLLQSNLNFHSYLNNLTIYRIQFVFFLGTFDELLMKIFPKLGQILH